MVDKDLELIVFEIERDMDTDVQKIKSRQLMDKLFEHTELVAIADDIDIDKAMDEMNNALS